MCPDIMSTGFSGAESGGIRIGDTVAIFAQGPIGLCVTAGASFMGATKIIVVELSRRKARCREADGRGSLLNFRNADPVDDIMRLTGRARRRCGDGSAREPRRPSKVPARAAPGGTLSSLGVYSTDLKIPLGPFAAGLGDNRIVTTLCPGGKERMRRLMNVVASGRVDLKPLVTHRFKLDDIEKAYDLFGHQRDNCLKVAITP